MPLISYIVKSITGLLTVSVVLAILGWVYYLYWQFCRLTLNTDNNPGLTGIVLMQLAFHSILGLLLTSYARTVLTDPGSPPTLPLEASSSSSSDRAVPTSDKPQEVAIEIPDRQGTPNATSAAANTNLALLPTTTSPLTPLFSDEQLAMVTAKRDGRPRYCRKCSRLKPDRTHHCSACGKCILKMDHHCPWVNNCVGFHNQKFFILFLIYCCVLCLYVLLTVAPLAFTGGPSDNISALVLCLISVIFGVTLTGFTAMHLNLVFTNKTSVESWERNRYRNVSGRLHRRQYLNVFDLRSRRRNWCQVMGKHPWLWFLPVATTPGDGVKFPYDHEAYDKLLSINDGDSGA